MENAVDSLKIAFGVLIFTVALSISISTFSNARRAIDGITTIKDKTQEYVYLEPSTTSNRDVGIETIIPLPEKGTAFLTEYPDNNSIKIKENGVYLVSYTLCGGTNEECSLTMSVKANDLLLPATNTTSEFQAQIVNCINSSTIISLNKDDLITLNVKSSMNVNISFNGSTNAMLSVIKIH